VGRDPFQDWGILPFSSQRPLLGPGDKIGLPQLMDMPIFSLLQSFGHGSLPALSSCSIGMRLGELHLEDSGEDLSFLRPPEADPQFQGLPVILLIQGKKVRGQMHHGRTILLRIPPLQSLHASPPCPPIPIQRWKEPHGGTSNGLLIDLAEVPQGFAGHNLVGVDKAKPGCGHTPGSSEVRELLTLPDVDSNLTLLGALLLILTAFMLRTIFDSELL